ncbi:MAG: hypothetical protein KC469_08645 [Flavobacteriaceae bacterium]|jgi:uncharacterized membrane protein|nr:hypothetical protein [Flavobacteriaceae bacterium]
MTEATIEEGKSNAIISYLTIIGTIIAFYLNNDKKNDFASFHIRQALGLWLTFFALGYVIGAFNSWMITMGWYLFFGVLFIFGFMTAIAGKTTPTPIVGPLYQKLFASFGK